AGYIQKLFSFEEVTRYADVKIHTSLKDAENTLKVFLMENNMAWTIFTAKEKSFAGIILVLGINQRHKFGSFASAVLPEFMSKGIISKAHKMVADYCFTKTDLHRLESQIYENHIAAEKMLIKSGMRFEGILRENFFIAGKFENSRVYSVLKGE
ncbi:MAG: GNAT family N-acetyltransferase, partial [Bacteroidales bacterium]|nr:GNAT family N-acetyltransferase [Bacteroidales bacterium]